MRPLNPLEAAIAVAVGGSVLAVVIPTFVRNVHASYVSEATRGISEIAARASAKLEAEQATSALPDSAPLTPSTVPRGTRVTDPPGTWDHPTWRALGFQLDTPHAYSFAFDADRTPELAKFKVHAHGDLDGDAVLSTIQIDGSFKPGTATELSAMDVQHEIE
jgi:hypothetical protein